MAEQAYCAYCHEFGYPPKNPQHLVSYSKKIGHPVSWSQCKKIMQAAPDPSSYVPPTDNKQKQTSAQPTKIPTKMPTKQQQRHSLKQTVKTINKRASVTRFQHLIVQLTAMGWEYEIALAALKSNNGNLHLAMESLMHGTHNRNGHQNKQNKQNPQNDRNNYNNYNNQPKPKKANSPKVSLKLSQTNYKKTSTVNSMTRPKLQNHKSSTKEQEIKSSFDRLLSGNASIKQRLNAMNKLFNNLQIVDISQDDGNLLLKSFYDQILDEDYIYQEYAVRCKAIQCISDIFVFLLNKLAPSKIENMISTSLEPILNNLFLIFDNNKSRGQHSIIQDSIKKITDAINAMNNNSSAMVALCSILNEKINSENVFQPKPRLFAFEQLKTILFGKDNNLINNIFDKGMTLKYSNGININKGTDLPLNMHWINCVHSNVWNNDDDETFRDIFMDCISLMILDPNRDNQYVALNLSVFMSQLNRNFNNSLEAESKHRFNKYYTPSTTTTNTDIHCEASPSPSPVPSPQPQQTQQQQQYNPYQKHYNSYKDYTDEKSKNGETDYKIYQQSDVSVAAPSLPDI